MDDWETKDEVFSQLDDIPEGLRGSNIAIKLLSEGNKTILQNFSEITKLIKRDPTLLRRYFIKILGMKITEIKGKLVFLGKVSKKQMEGILNQFIAIYIICPNCSKPDTLLQGNKKKLKLKCAACGKTSDVVKT